MCSNKEAKFIFVGERPSRTAVRRGWTWEHGRLAAKTLHDALARIGINPMKQKHVNLFGDGCDRDAESIEINKRILLIRRLNRRGYKVVGMGRRVCQRLREAEVIHLSIRHPAARGKLRRRDLYTAHVRQSLAGDLKSLIPSRSTKREAAGNKRPLPEVKDVKPQRKGVEAQP